MTPGSEGCCANETNSLNEPRVPLRLSNGLWPPQLVEVSAVSSSARHAGPTAVHAPPSWDRTTMPPPAPVVCALASTKMVKTSPVSSRTLNEPRYSGHVLFVGLAGHAPLPSIKPGWFARRVQVAPS